MTVTVEGLKVELEADCFENFLEIGFKLNFIVLFMGL